MSLNAVAQAECHSGDHWRWVDISFLALMLRFGSLSPLSSATQFYLQALVVLLQFLAFRYSIYCRLG